MLVKEDNVLGMPTFLVWKMCFNGADVDVGLLVLKLAIRGTNNEGVVVGDDSIKVVGVETVECGASKGDGKVELVHGKDVRGQDGGNVTVTDSEGREGRGQLEATTIGLRLSGVGVIVDNGRGYPFVD